MQISVLLAMHDAIDEIETHVDFFSGLSLRSIGAEVVKCITGGKKALRPSHTRVRLSHDFKIGRSDPIFSPIGSF